jgi:hypothetical protein
MHKRAKAKASRESLQRGGELALGHLAACDLVLYWPDGWVWQGWTKSGRHATPVRLQKHQHQGTSSSIPRPCDTRFDGGVRSAAGIFLDTAVQPAASFRSVVSAHLPPTRLFVLQRLRNDQAMTSSQDDLHCCANGLFFASAHSPAACVSFRKTCLTVLHVYQ